MRMKLGFAVFVAVGVFLSARHWTARAGSTVIAAHSSRHVAAPMAMVQVTRGQPTPGLIDGSVHPDLIPDSIAYRLYFVAVAAGESATANDLARPRAFLARAGLSDADIGAASPILASFKARYLDLIQQYNSSPDVKDGRPDGLRAFLAQRDSLVQATRDQLAASLSAGGLANLQAHVEDEKANMRVSPAEAQQ